MPLDKIEDVEEYVKTHESVILHIKNNPVACILEKSIENESKFTALEKDAEIKASLTGFLNKHEDLGLIMGCKLKIQMNDELLEYTLYPHTDVIDTIIFNETIFIIDEKMNQIFSCKILTDQFVKTKSEFKKINKLLKD